MSYKRGMDHEYSIAGTISNIVAQLEALDVSTKPIQDFSTILCVRTVCILTLKQYMSKLYQYYTN